MIERITDAFEELTMPPGAIELADMHASESLVDMLREHEGRALLVPTNLGDGGWTIGYGRFEKSRAALPERITLADAEAMFREDIARRGEDQVRRYVTVPLEQHQFDALTSMAYNLSPRAFRQIAEAVNAGDDPTPVALRFTRPGSQFERGLVKRRRNELALFNFGTYA